MGFSSPYAQVLLKMKGVSILDAIILGIIEGLTEYLPVSSTGHLIVASHFLGLENSAFLKSFEIVIQSGAILSVLLVYRKQFFQDFQWSLYQKIATAFLPAAVVGFLLKKLFDQMLESLLIVAVTMFLGGLFLIWMEKKQWFQKNAKTIQDLDTKNCLLLGLFQCLAIIPGTSRSGASIVGGLALGLKKEEATRFSFFLAVPTLLGATALKIKDVIPHLNPENVQLLGIGWFISFVVGVLAIKGFIKIVSSKGFVGFGVYRVIAGLFLLWFLNR